MFTTGIYFAFGVATGCAILGIAWLLLRSFCRFLMQCPYRAGWFGVSEFMLCAVVIAGILDLVGHIKR